MAGRRWWSAMALAVGACANPAADQALHARDAMIGMPKKTLLSCAGVPERLLAFDSQEFLTYHSSRIIYYPGWGGYWRWPMYAADVIVIDCKATFTLRNGLVERITYGGVSGGETRLGQCYAIVRNCIALAPQHPAPLPDVQGN